MKIVVKTSGIVIAVYEDMCATIDDGRTITFTCPEGQRNSHRWQDVERIFSNVSANEMPTPIKNTYIDGIFGINPDYVEVEIPVSGA